MLTVPQLEAVRADDPLVYEALKRVVAAINSLGQRPSPLGRLSAF
jgi:hypothetical protein